MLPANLAAPCEPLDDAPVTQKETAQWIVGTAGKYADCASKHRRAVKAMQGGGGE